MGDRGSGIGDGGRGEREEGSGKWEVESGERALECSNTRMLDCSTLNPRSPIPAPKAPLNT